jgi:hypothetical protein
MARNMPLDRHLAEDLHSLIETAGAPHEKGLPSLPNFVQVGRTETTYASLLR